MSTNIPKIWHRYGHDMPKICPGYALDMPNIYALDMTKVCLRYDQEMTKKGEGDIQ